MKKIYLSIAFLSLHCLNTLNAQNHNYLMDTSFGNGGYTIVPTTMPKVLSIDLFSGSKIRVTGYRSTGSNDDGHKTVQLLNTGVLDLGFSSDGIEEGTPTFFSKSSATAINNNTEMLILGREYTPEWEYKIIKVKNNGLANLNFGNSGFVMSSNNGVNEDPGFIVQLSNGNFLFSTKSTNTVSLRSLSSDGISTATLHSSYQGTSNNFQDYCKTQSGKILFSGTYFSANDSKNMYHFLNADGTHLNLVYQDDAQTVGSETIIASTYDELNQNFMILENYYSSTSDARFHLKKFNANGVSVARYTYAVADFGFSPTKIIALGGFTYALGTNSNNLMIAKLTQNGDFDTTFGNGGIATIDISENITTIDNITSDGINAIYVSSGNMSSTTSVFVMKINVTNNLGVNDFVSDNSNTLVFPNPTKGMVNFNEKVDTVLLFDVNGKNLKKFNEVTKVDLSELQNGTYFLNLTTNGKSSTKKVIIQK